MTQPLDLDYLLTLAKPDGSQNSVPVAPPAPSPSLAGITPATVLLGDAWPAPGNRHVAAMALAGGLVRYVDDDTAIRLLEGVREVAGCDKPWKARVLVEQARARKDAGETYTGWPELKKYVDPGVVDAARKLLGMEAEVWVDGSVLGDRLGDDPAPGADPEDPLNVVTPGKKSPCSHKEVVYFLSQTPAWAGVFRFNVLSRRHVAVRPPFPMRMEQGNLSKGDLGKIRCWFDSQGLKVSAEAIDAAIAVIAESPGRSWNPFAEYLDALPVAAGGLAVSSAALFGVQDTLSSTLLTKTLVAAVRRVRAMPGIGQDPTPVDHQGVLLLAGDQDAGKGHLVHILGGRFYKKLDVRRLKDKDTVIKAQGAVLVELEEISAHGRDRESLKAFLSACDDEERAAYERGAEVVPRSYAMIATTNDPRLEDPTGHRRWWPVILPPGRRVNVAMAEALRDAYWSEANALASTDFDHHLTEAEKAQCAELCGELEAEDSRQADVLDACAGRQYITLREVYDHMTKGTRKDEPPSKGEEHLISDSLKRLGCVKARPYINGLQTKAWEVPKAFQARSVSPDGAAYRASLEVAAGLRAITRN